MQCNPPPPAADAARVGHAPAAAAPAFADDATDAHGVPDAAMFRPRDEAAADARAWLEVDLAALVRNARRLQARAGVPLLPMVKADAYGLGAVPVAHALEPLAPWGYGVATVDEGVELRRAGVRRPVLVLTPLLADALAPAHAAALTPSLHRADDVQRWAALGGGAWHLSVDTGMARAGVRWDAIDDALLDALAEHPPEGVYTHYHSADGDGTARAAQEVRFTAALGRVVDRLGRRPALVHVENSPGVSHNPAGSRWDLCRPGVFLFGVATGGALVPEPVLHLRARVVDLRTLQPGDTVSYDATWTARRPTRIATVPVGYADGYRRALSDVGTALVGGQPVRVAGRVTMDMTMLDVTDVPCALGDQVTLLGTDGARTVTVCDLADASALSPYELLTGLRLRLPRRYRPARAADLPSAAPDAAPPGALHDLS